MDRRATIIVISGSMGAMNMEIAAPALRFTRNPSHGQPRSLKETRRSQRKGGRR